MENMTEDKINTVYGIELPILKAMIDWFLKQGWDPRDKDFTKELSRRYIK